MSDGRLPLYQLIEPSAIPGIHVDVAQIQDAAQLLDQSAQSIRDHGAQVETEWDALAGVYDAPEAPELFMIVKGNRGVGTVSRDLAVDYSKAASALSTLSYALSAPIKTLKDLHEQALDFRNSIQGGVVEVPTTSGTSGQTSMKEVGWADDISTKARNTQLIQAVNAAYVQLDEAKAEAINAINAIEPSTSTLFSTGPGYVPASLDALNAPGAELPYGMPRTADSCSTENISNTGTQWFSDSVNGLTSLGGYNIYTGEGSWATAGAAWSALGMTAAGAVLFSTPAGWALQSALSNIKGGGELPAPLKAVDDFVNGAGDQAAAAVAGFTQWDTWATDPGAAATNVVLNVGSMFIPVGGAGAGIKALTSSAKVGVIIEKVAGAATHIPGGVGPALSTGIRVGAAGAVDALKGLKTVLDAPGVLAVEAVRVVKSHVPVFEPSLAGIDNGITHLANEATTTTPVPSGGGGGGGHGGDTSSSSSSTGYDSRNYNADGTIKEGPYGEISPERRDELLRQQDEHHVDVTNEIENASDGDAIPDPSRGPHPGGDIPPDNDPGGNDTGLSGVDQARIDHYQQMIDSGRYPPWVTQMFEGSIFNIENWPRYEANEIYLDIGDGKRSIVDSLNLGEDGEVVSRKNTQLGAVNLSTSLNYLDEFVKKYETDTPRITIADTPGNRASLPPEAIGKSLDGDMILEVPVQSLPIPQTILTEATARGIQIRDVSGHIYNPISE